MATGSSFKVKCPQCGKRTDYDAGNPYRPFCCERCQTLDLGAWADEAYRVPVSDSNAVNENSSANSDVEESLPLKNHLN